MGDPVQEAMEKACRAVCPWCALVGQHDEHIVDRAEPTTPEAWHHRHVTKGEDMGMITWEKCNASPIRCAFERTE